MPISYVLLALFSISRANHACLDMAYLRKEFHWPSDNGDGKQF
jgi:hypothetical protein